LSIEFLGSHGIIGKTLHVPAALVVSSTSTLPSG
jgi:hypothetical protein